VKKIIIDTDPGMDDAVAIMFALRSKQFDLRAITTVSGNLTADRCAVNARRILEFLDATHIPVARGLQHPLERPYPRDPFSHGDDGLANLGLPQPTMPEDARSAADLIVQTVAQHAGDISILCIGPLTNIALALALDPRLPLKVTELIAVAGAYRFDVASSLPATGDNPVSEWNVYVDPEAADIVFRAGFNLTAIGLDVATQEAIHIGEEHRARLQASKRKEAWFLKGVVDFVEQRGFRSYCALIDALAVAAALDPTIFATEEVRVGIETKGLLTLGQTVVDRRQHFAWTDLPRVRVAYAVEANRFLGLLLDALT